MTPELKPCPFCGTHNQQVMGKEDTQLRLCRVCCEECGFGGPNFNSREQAIGWWNRRDVDSNDTQRVAIELSQCMIDQQSRTPKTTPVEKLVQSAISVVSLHRKGCLEPKDSMAINALFHNAIDVITAGEREWLDAWFEDAKKAMPDLFRMSSDAERDDTGT